MRLGPLPQRLETFLGPRRRSQVLPLAWALALILLAVSGGSTTLFLACLALSGPKLAAACWRRARARSRAIVPPTTTEGSGGMESAASDDRAEPPAPEARDAEDATPPSPPPAPGPDAPAVPEAGPEPDQVKARRPRRRKRGWREPLPETPCATFVCIGPGRYVRVEGPAPSSDQAPSAPDQGEEEDVAREPGPEPAREDSASGGACPDEGTDPEGSGPGRSFCEGDGGEEGDLEREEPSPSPLAAEVGHGPAPGQPSLS